MKTDPFAEQLFAIANEHSQPRQQRVDQIVPLLLALEAEKFRPDTHSWENSDHNWEQFKLHSLIDRKKELLFFGNFVQLIFKHYGNLVQSFSWSQRQEYDDNFFPFGLQEIQLNDFTLTYVYLEAFQQGTFIDGSSELQYPPEDFMYRHKAASLGLLWEGPLDDAFWGKVNELELDDVHTAWGPADEETLEAFTQTYEPPGAVFLIFMQSLVQAYGPNYLIDLFGWSCSVRIDETGISLELVQRTPSFPLEPDMPAYQQKTIQKTTSEKPWWRFW